MSETRPTGYPTPREVALPAAAQQRYRNPPENNPRLSGLPLVILSRIVQHFPPLAKILWHNADFGSLTNFKFLDQCPTRYDPCVIPTPSVTALPSKPDPSYPLFSTTDPAFYTSNDYILAYRTKRTTPTAVAEYLLQLIRSPPHSLAFVDINNERTLAAAKSSTARYEQGKPIGPLDGVPIAVKDEVDIYGYQTTFGSSKVFAHKGCETAWAVRKLEEAGAIVIGKTNMHELGTDTTNNNPVKGTPRNPCNPDYYTGGSSGGSAYAVGAGLVPIAVGEDGGGSIRVPATYCGVYGIKTSHGRISARPSLSLSTSNGVAGPIAATLDDLTLAYRIMSSPDPLDPFSSAFPPPALLLSHIASPHRKLLGLYRPWFDDCTPIVRARCQRAVQNLIDNFGYGIVEIDLPYLHELRLAHALSIISEMHAAIGGDVSGLNAPNRILLSIAAQTPAHTYVQTAKLRSLAMSHLAYLYSIHPGMIIVTPTTPMPGVPIRAEEDLTYGISDTNTSLRSMRYVFLSNFSGCPSVVSGVGYDDEKSGLMISLMGMAEWGREEALIGFARDVASASFGERRRGRIWVDVLGAVGAGRGWA
ncbi:amidase signature domain-containing protein [Cristinia sonorae]|uniref:Amidase signature domain-containing protein n=1 Tax=Cristinia sonorae TaxID=1940300 RepID=A0A8K0UJ67_9AGAR|nr:amidase signature domain-containing protein [Cristinia sonorae]